MTKQNTRIDGEKNLASDAVVVGKKEKEKNKQQQRKLKGRGGSPTWQWDCHWGRERPWAIEADRGWGRGPGGGRGRERRAAQRSLSGSMEEAAAPMADAMGFANLPASACGTPVARAYTQTGLFSLRSREFWISLGDPLFFVVWPGPAASPHSLGPTPRWHLSILLPQISWPMSILLLQIISWNLSFLFLRVLFCSKIDQLRVVINL